MVELFLVVLAALAWFWADELKARERALAAAAHACAQHDVQLLDHSVVLLALRLTRAPIRLQRTYRFEFSRDGAARETATLRLEGRYVTRMNRADGSDWWANDNP